MTINNKLLLYVTLVSLIEIVCSSVAIIVLLIMDKKDGFINNLDMAMTFPSNCQAYIINKYQLEYYKIKMKTISVAIVILALISLILLVLMIILRRKQLLGRNNKLEAQKQTTNKKNIENKDQIQNEDNKHTKIHDQLSIPIQTDRSAKEMLLNKQINSSNTQMLSAQMKQLYYPFTTIFFISFSIIILLLVVPLSFHLSFYIQWRSCEDTYDISQTKLIVFFVLQGVSIMLAFVTFCVNLHHRYQFFYLQQEKRKQQKLTKIEKQNKANKINQKNQNKMTQQKQKQKQQQFKQTLQQKPNQIPRSKENNKNQQKNIDKGAPTINNDISNKKNSSNSLTISNSVDRKCSQSESVPLDDFKNTKFTKQKGIIKSSQLQEVKQVEQNYETTKQTYPVIVKQEMEYQLIRQGEDMNRKQQLTVGKLIVKNNVQYQESKMMDMNNGVNQNIDNRVISGGVDLMRGTSSQGVENRNNFDNKDKQQFRNYQIPSYQNQVVSKAFNEIDGNELVVIKNQRHQHNILSMDIKNDNIRQEIEMVPIMKDKQQIQQYRNNDMNSIHFQFEQSQSKPSQSHLNQVKHYNHNNHKQKTNFTNSLLQKQTTLEPVNSLLSNQQQQQLIKKKKKQLKFCTTVYSIEQSSPFASFTSNVITSRISHQNNNPSYLIKQHQRKSSENYLQNQFSDYDQQRYMLNNYDQQRYVTNNQGGKFRGFADDSYQRYHITRESQYKKQRFSPTSKKIQISPQLPYQLKFTKQSQKKRLSNEYCQQQQNYDHDHHYVRSNQKLSSANYNYHKKNKKSIKKNNDSQNQSKRSFYLPVPQKQQVYDRYKSIDYQSVIMPVISGDESHLSGSSYYHNSIKKEINSSGDRVWDSNGNRDKQREYHSKQFDSKHYHQINNLQNKNIDNKVDQIPKTLNSNNNNKNNPIFNTYHNNISPQHNQQALTKIQKKQKKLKKHLKQKKNKINEQQSQLDKKVIQQSVKYLNKNNYNSVLNPVIEQNKHLKQLLSNQEQQLQEKLLQQQLKYKFQTQKRQTDQIQQKANPNFVKQKNNHNNLNSNLKIPKQLQNSNISINSNKNSIKLRQKRQKTKRQLNDIEQNNQSPIKINNINILVKYNDLYYYKNKVLKKRRNSDANINLQNYQPVTVQPFKSANTKKITQKSTSLPKRQYLDPQFKPNVILLTPQAIKERKISK